MLLIDGVKYHEWAPKSEDEFEQVVKEHTQEIFGDQSIYFDRKQKLKSLAGISSIPDGYALILGDVPQWHVVEVELSSHPLDQHIVSQLGRFIMGIKNPNTQREIALAMHRFYRENIEVTRDGFFRLKVAEPIHADEIYKFLSDVISKPPIITVVIEKSTPELHEALDALAHPIKSVVEFRTFAREGVGLAVHAHLFEPLYEEGRRIGWTDEYGYTLAYSKGDYEVYERGGEFSIEKLPHRNRVAKELKSLDEAKKWIHNKIGDVPPLPVPPSEDFNKIKASDFAYNGNGIYALKSNPSITIDVRKRIKLVGEQLARQRLWNKRLGSFYWLLRKKAGLLNTPTEE